jgi:peptide/nickel transport system permease protein
MSPARTLLALAFLAVAAAAPLLAPYDPGRQFADYQYAPPTAVRMDGGGIFAVPTRLVDRLMGRYEAVPGARVALPWWATDEDAPVFLLGTDDLGRDVLSRVLHGARLSVGLGVVATLATLMLGAALGGWAGVTGGRVEAVLLQMGDVMLVAPITYLVVLLRAWLPERLDTLTAFAAMTCVFAVATWPWVARGVRAIVATEREREYVVAARALGATPGRVLWYHLLPACRGFLLGQVALLVPTFVLAEAALSFVGLGFPADVASWGAMIHSASDVTTIVDRPWLLAPAAAVFLLVLAANVTSNSSGQAPLPVRDRTGQSGYLVAAGDRPTAWRPRGDTVSPAAADPAKIGGN